MPFGSFRGRPQSGTGRSAASADVVAGAILLDVPDQPVHRRDLAALGGNDVVRQLAEPLAADVGPPTGFSLSWERS